MADIKFTTDGWRGIIAWDFTFENVRRLAQALADFINENAPSSEPGKHTVAVGYDRRFLSDRFAADIAAILRSNKIDVILLSEPVSSPVLSCLSMEQFWMGIIVTASHNKPHWNGVKIKIEGASASPRITKEIEGFIDESPVLYLHGQKAEQKDFKNVYLKYLNSHINTKKIQGIKSPIVFDYMYGSAAGIAEKVLPKNKIITLREEYDPSFKGIKPEPIAENLTELMTAVTKNKAALGIAFDGDGDRVTIIDEKGSCLTPEILSAILLNYLIKNKKLKGRVVQTLSMGYLLKRIARKQNMPFEEVNIGFKYVAEKMAVEDVAFGVEESGGYAWKGIVPDRDGMIVALTFLYIMASTGKKASELVANIEKEYGASVYLRNDHPLKKPLDKGFLTDKIKRKVPAKILGYKIAQTITQDGLKIIFEDDEWLLIRPSGTEPLLRVYAETSDKKKTQALLDFGYKLAVPFIK
ncbi:Phosphomannomutase [Elusimicrobium minutum Pei191]|uniref:Phosphomannomutase n=1 Tax=Elusimicrobium minutum (strain Pei191) TaxID=445932 RepID=B2KAY4_ELUMP|nr:phosphoglucomutase/phosphomannomutase family protein [Elusimicrobium minutum]ACC97680.1 Phosphomannomutase [Elusimicrobium minutum Pei191]